MKCIIRVLCLSLVAGLALQALPAAAQSNTTGLVRGTVTDPSGAVLPGVMVDRKSVV